MKPLALFAILALASCSNPSEPPAKIVPPPAYTIPIDSAMFSDTTEALEPLPGKWGAIENAVRFIITDGAFVTRSQSWTDRRDEIVPADVSIRYDGSTVWIHAVQARQWGEGITFRGNVCADSIYGAYIVLRYHPLGSWPDERYPLMHLTFRPL